MDKYKLSVLTSAFLFIILWNTPNSFATSITLTTDGLGLKKGNYGSFLDVSDNITLSAITKTGIGGTIYVGKEGIGVEDDKGKGNKRKGNKGKRNNGIGVDEAIIFNYSAPVIPSSVVLGLSNFKKNDSFILTIDSLKVSDGITKLLEDSFVYTGKNKGTLSFGILLQHLPGVTSMTALSVGSDHGSFFVNSYANHEVPVVPNPEPATIALLGIGLAGLAGAEVRRRRKKKAVDKS